jgi:hypothetical protein
MALCATLGIAADAEAADVFARLTSGTTYGDVERALASTRLPEPLPSGADVAAWLRDALSGERDAATLTPAQRWDAHVVACHVVRLVCAASCTYDVAAAVLDACCGAMAWPVAEPPADVFGNLDARHGAWTSAAGMDVETSVIAAAVESVAWPAALVPGCVAPRFWGESRCDDTTACSQ